MFAQNFYKNTMPALKNFEYITKVMPIEDPANLKRVQNALSLMFINKEQ